MNSVLDKKIKWRYMIQWDHIVVASLFIACWMIVAALFMGGWTIYQHGKRMDKIEAAIVRDQYYINKVWGEGAGIPITPNKQFTFPKKGKGRVK